jgi:hypothetical protein
MRFLLWNRFHDITGIGRGEETMTRRLPTIDDVARVAGVGKGTASRVINGSPKVSDSTRQRVLATIDELNFRPSAMARRLSKR